MGDLSDRTRRFRQLGTTAAPRGPARRRDRTGDLFAHFGVEIERPSPSAPVPAVEAAACHGCGWLLAYNRPAPPCPMCGDPEPLRASSLPR